MMSGNMLGAQGGQGGSGLINFLSGLFGNNQSPYSAAMQPYSQYMGMAAGAQNPFYNFGTSALPQYQNWLSGMSNPSEFINAQMKNYQSSPWANYLQQQAIRSGQNAASASGLQGSTPFAQQLQQNASNISSGDMQNYLQNVLGINSQYGQGLMNQIGSGQNAANNLSNIFGNQATGMGNLAYGQQYGQNQDWSQMLSGGLGMLLHGIFS